MNTCINEFRKAQNQASPPGPKEITAAASTSGGVQACTLRCRQSTCRGKEEEWGGRAHRPTILERMCCSPAHIALTNRIWAHQHCMAGACDSRTPGVVVHMQHGDLAVVLLEDHDPRVDKLVRLRKTARRIRARRRQAEEHLARAGHALLT